MCWLRTNREQTPTATLKTVYMLASNLNFSLSASWLRCSMFAVYVITGWKEEWKSNSHNILSSNREYMAWHELLSEIYRNSLFYVIRPSDSSLIEGWEWEQSTMITKLIQTRYRLRVVIFHFDYWARSASCRLDQFQCLSMDKNSLHGCKSFRASCSVKCCWTLRCEDTT